MLISKAVTSDTIAVLEHPRYKRGRWGVLDVTTDYLMSGTQDDMTEGISDKELMTQFKRIAQLPKERKAMVKEFLDAFLLKNDLKEKLAQ